MKQNKYNSTIRPAVTRPRIHSKLSLLYEHQAQSEIRGSLPGPPGCAIACRLPLQRASRQKCYVHEPNWKSTQSGAEKRSLLSLIPPMQRPRERVAHLAQQGKAKQTPSEPPPRLCLFTRRAAFCYPFCGDAVIYATENEARRRQTPDACSRTLIMICATHFQIQNNSRRDGAIIWRCIDKIIERGAGNYLRLVIMECDLMCRLKFCVISCYLLLLSACSFSSLEPKLILLRCLLTE